MANKKGFESFTESTNVSDIFDFAESKNQNQLLNEDFVFKFEDNSGQTGLDLNDPSLGLEDNPNEEERKVDQELSNDDKKELEKNAENGTESAEAGEAASSSSASSASSASSSAASSSAAAGASGAAATVAATATAAVVLVVGGGMVVYGQGLDQPNICQFDEIGVVENNINFTLAIGNDRARIDDGSENDECDVYIQLKCPSMEDFEERVQVSNYGIIPGSFADLEYDTEYVVTVYQNIMMLDSAEALISPISLFTEKQNVEPEPEPGPEPGPEPEPGELIGSVSVYREVGPLDNHRYFMEVSANQELPTYASYKVGFNPITSDSSSGATTGEWAYTFPYDVTTMGKQLLQEVYDSDLTADEYEFGFIGYDENENATVLFSNTVSVADMEDFEYDRDVIKLYLKCVVIFDSLSGTQYKYYCFFNYNEDIYGELTGRIKVTASSIGDTNPFMTDYIMSPNEECELSGWDLDGHSDLGRYTVTVSQIAYSDQQTEEETVLWQENVRFKYLPRDYYTNPTLNGATFLIGQNADDTIAGLYVNLDYNDPDGLWNDHLFSIELTNVSSGTSYVSTTSDYPTLVNRFKLEGITSDEIESEYQSEFDYTIKYDGTVVYTSDEPFKLYQCETFIVDGSVNFYYELSPTGGDGTLKYNVYFSSVYESYDSIYLSFTGGTREFAFEETVNYVNKPQEFVNDTTDLVEDGAVKVQTFGVVDSSPNLIYETEVNFTDLQSYRPSSVDGLDFSIGSYSTIKEYLFVNLTIVDPAHEWRGTFAVTFTSTDTPSYTYSSTVVDYYESGLKYLENIDVDTIFATQNEEYTVTLEHEGEVIYESAEVITYEDLTKANITGSIQIGFEPDTPDDSDELVFTLLDANQSLSNAFNVYVVFTNIDEEAGEQPFSFENLVPDEPNSTGKTRGYLTGETGKTYIVDTYVVYSEDDVPTGILIARGYITFSSN